MSSTKPKDDTKFDSVKFNAGFEEEKKKVKQENQEKENKKLQEMNKSDVDNKPDSLYNMPFGNILINTKDAWVAFIDAALSFNITFELLTTKNRMFYLGGTIILIVLIILTVDFILGGNLSEGVSSSDKNMNINVNLSGLPALESSGGLRKLL